MRRQIFGAALTLALLTASTPAQAGPWTAVCALRVTLQFRSPMRAPLSNGAYDLSVGSVADLDPTNPGTQSCAATLSGETTTSTTVTGTGHASVWSCGAAVASGSWHQGFGPEGPAPFGGTHLLTGTWGHWTLHISNSSLNVVGVGELTLQAVEGTKTPGCATGELQSLTMVGTIVLQDP